MAQSNGDERLRDKVDTILNHFEVTVPDVGDVGLFDLVHPRVEDKYGNGVEWGIVMSEELMQLILADRKQHELEARLSVIDNLLDTFEDWGEERAAELIRDHYVERDELKAERERLGE